MRRLRDLPIRSKLIAIAMLPSSAALLLCCIAFLSYQQMAARRNMLEQLAATATLLGNNSAAALAAGDAAAAGRTLKALENHSDILGGAIYGADRKVFAWYRRAGEHAAPPPLREDGHHFSHVSLSLYRSIARGGSTLGTIYLEQSLEQIHAQLLHNSLIGAVVIVFALLAAFLLSTRLLTEVSGPISQLAEVVHRVALRKDYSIRARKYSQDELGQLIDGFNEMLQQIQLRDSALEEARGGLEAHVRNRTQELSQEVAERKQAEEALRKERESFKALLENIQAVPWEMDTYDGACSYIGPQVERLWGWPAERFATPGFFLGIVRDERDRQHVLDCAARLPTAGALQFEATIRKRDGGFAHVRSLLSHGRRIGDQRRAIRGITIDITAQKKLETDLQQAQKLESVGRLAAGVAHEINTPVQFVNDSCHFMRDGLAELQTLLQQYRGAVQALAAGQATPEQALRELQGHERAADIDYLLENMPGAIGRSLDGLERVASIVRSMKEFAHPDQKEKAYADLNQAILSTLTIARNEYKYVADVETELGEIPPVCCFLGDLNQAVLNIVVNAAHAIGDVVRGSGERGRIVVRTAQAGTDVLISIQDSGGGIPEAIRDKIFDPFFTTKEVGVGTGQGLAIVRSVVVDKHQGELYFHCEPGRGTTFFIRLPIEPRKAQPERAAA